MNDVLIQLQEELRWLCGSPYGCMCSLCFIIGVFVTIKGILSNFVSLQAYDKEGLQKCEKCYAVGGHLILVSFFCFFMHVILSA